MRRALAITMAVLMTACILAGCNDGFDPGMKQRCAATWLRASPAWADQTDCPGDIPTLFSKGQIWGVGVNAPYGNNAHCNGLKIAEDGSATALINWLPDSTFRHTVEMGIVKDSCAGTNAEISFGMGQPGLVPVKGLKLEDQMSLMKSTGYTTVQFYSKIDINGQRYGLGLVLRPRGGDPRYDNPAPCVLYKGGTDVGGHHELSLDASCFGIAKMSCATCAYATVHIDWDSIYNWVFTKHPGWWPAVQQAYATAQTSIDIELMTFRKSSGDHPRVKIWHRGWRLWHD